MKRQQPLRNIDGIIRPVKTTSLRKRFMRALASSRLIQLFVGLIMVGATTGIILFAKNMLSTPNYDDVSTMERAIAQHVLAPDETPILATVTDKTALKTPFLKGAENGDRIVIYPKAKKVIIYRPSLDRIVDVGPVDVNNIPNAR